MELEITEIPALDPGETSLVEMHSLLNIMNVLIGELALIGLRFSRNPSLLTKSKQICERVIESLRDPGQALASIASVAADQATILAEIEEARVRHHVSADESKFKHSHDNIVSIFQILDVRTREMLAWSRAPEDWVSVDLPVLRKDFVEVFAAIEKNSNGRYRIIYNLALQEPVDYYVDFVVESADHRTVALPLLFKDVMRDLVANARKYTEPGGVISIGLYETADRVTFVVQDNGRGIPPEEIESVVHYGRRGSNVGEVRTMGGGFGLTKAFLVTKRFGGRMWIKSELGGGTRIRLTLPRPINGFAHPAGPN